VTLLSGQAIGKKASDPEIGLSNNDLTEPSLAAWPRLPQRERTARPLPSFVPADECVDLVGNLRECPNRDLNAKDRERREDHKGRQIDEA
jgi:hypothetical protein